MGCVQSVPRKPRRNKQPPPSPPEESRAAQLLAAQQVQAAAVQAGNLQTSPREKEIGPESSDNTTHAKPRDTAVLKKAGKFDQLHEEALKMPSLRDVKVVRGANSMRLLEGFEQKEAEARAMPKLVQVDGVDVKESGLYGRLKEFELKEEKARAEPKLEKTFMERERESIGAGAGEKV